MATMVRKLLYILSSSILLQLAVKGQYIDYNEDTNDKENLQVLFDSQETVPFEIQNLNSNLNVESKENTELYIEERQPRNSMHRTKETHHCIAYPKYNQKTYFGVNKHVEYMPNYIQEFDCTRYNSTLYDKHENGGICYIPGEYCAPKIKKMTILKRERGNHFWIRDYRYIYAGCNCHLLNYGF